MPIRTTAFSQLRRVDRQRRRRLVVTFVVALAAHALLIAWAPAESPLDRVDSRRFGYFGPARLLPEIEVRRDESEEAARLREGGIQAVAVEEHTGGGETAAPNPQAPAPGQPKRPRLAAEGAELNELRRVNLPVVQSEDLVIDVLVRPTYPPEAQARGLEAVVELEALVDDQGRVRTIRILENTGDPLFAETSRQAVRQCRFRPYLVDGKPSPVYARFRFNFKLI